MLNGIIVGCYVFDKKEVNVVKIQNQSTGISINVMFPGQMMLQNLSPADHRKPIQGFLNDCTTLTLCYGQV